MAKVKLTTDQITALNKLWFVYGNNGKKHTHHNHRFIQNLIEHGEDSRDFYKDADKTTRANNPRIDWSKVVLTKDCIEAVDAILN
jgi:hypothetical protein